MAASEYQAALRVAACQFDVRWESIEANLSTAERLAAKAAQEEGADLILLPEMFSTGFSIDPARTARPMTGLAVSWMRRTARRLDCAVGGSVAVVEQGRYYNRFVLALPDGTAPCYDKRHLFTVSGERGVYTPGCRSLVVPFRGWRLRPLICYDLRFPVWSRNRGDYDVLLYVASWPAVRRAVWQALLPARAIENAAYVVGVNRVGADPTAHYTGDTAVYDFKGRTMAAAGDSEQIVRAQLDSEALHAFRRRFDVLSDADAFTLEG